MNGLSPEGRSHDSARKEQGGEMTEEERKALRHAVTARDLTACLRCFRSRSVAEMMSAFGASPDRETEALARVVDLLIGHLAPDDDLQRKLREIQGLTPARFQPRRSASRSGADAKTQPRS